MSKIVSLSDYQRRAIRAPKPRTQTATAATAPNPGAVLILAAMAIDTDNERLAVLLDEGTTMPATLCATDVVLVDLRHLLVRNAELRAQLAASAK